MFWIDYYRQQQFFYVRGDFYKRRKEFLAKGFSWQRGAYGTKLLAISYYSHETLERDFPNNLTPYAQEAIDVFAGGRGPSNVPLPPSPMTGLQLTFEDGQFWATTSAFGALSRPLRQSPEWTERGFAAGSANLRWSTQNWKAAKELAEHGNDEAILAITAAEVEQVRRDAAAEERIAASWRKVGSIDVPAPVGLALRPFQVAGVEYALAQPNCLIADEPGLGKTLQAIGVANVLGRSIRKILVVVPASQKKNWLDEFTKWDVHGRTYARIWDAAPGWPTTDVVILNYDRLAKFAEQIETTQWDLLICDEAHILKNEDAIRTKLVFGGDIRGRQHPPIAAARKIFITGTPISNAPIDMWPLIHALDPDGLGRSYGEFVNTYCDPRNTCMRGSGRGITNPVELQNRMRGAFMVRRPKAEVLTDLPPKRRQVIEIEPSGRGLVNALEAEQRAQTEAADMQAEIRRELERIGKTLSRREYERKVKQLNNAPAIAFQDMSRVRHQTALAKVPVAVDYCAGLLAERPKILVFAHHGDVINGMVEGLKEFGAVKYTGDQSEKARNDAVEAFEKNPAVRVFIGSIKASGVGLTLNAADTSVFVEMDWVPSAISQSEDRCHRIGQRNNVLVHHLVVTGSIDSKMIKVVLSKQELCDAALDRHSTDSSASIYDESDQPPPLKDPVQEGTRQRVLQWITVPQIFAVHTALKRLAADSSRLPLLNDFDLQAVQVLADPSRVAISGAQAFVGLRILLTSANDADRQELGAQLAKFAESRLAAEQAEREALAADRVANEEAVIEPPAWQDVGNLDAPAISVPLPLSATADNIWPIPLTVGFEDDDEAVDSEPPPQPEPVVAPVIHAPVAHAPVAPTPRPVPVQTIVVPVQTIVAPPRPPITTSRWPIPLTAGFEDDELPPPPRPVAPPAPVYVPPVYVPPTPRPAPAPEPVYAPPPPVAPPVQPAVRPLVAVGGRSRPTKPTREPGLQMSLFGNPNLCSGYVAILHKNERLLAAAETITDIVALQALQAQHMTDKALKIARFATIKGEKVLATGTSLRDLRRLCEIARQQGGKVVGPPGVQANAKGSVK